MKVKFYTKNFRYWTKDYPLHYLWNGKHIYVKLSDINKHTCENNAKQKCVAIMKKKRMAKYNLFMYERRTYITYDLASEYLNLIIDRDFGIIRAKETIFDKLRDCIFWNVTDISFENKKKE